MSKLRRFLPELMHTELTLALAVPGSITICPVVAHIIKEYHCHEDAEKIVADLLSELLRLHFYFKKPVYQD